MFGQLAAPDLKALRTFYTIVISGGFTSAQVELGVSAATISTQMSHLETRLGMRLCQRGHSGFRLTSEGEKVFKSCERLFSAIEDFRSEVANTADVLVGELRIGLINNTITHPDLHINAALAAFYKAAPRVKIVIFVGLEKDVEARVLDGRLHFGVTLERGTLPQLEYLQLARENFVPFCGRGHPLYDRPDGQINLQTLASLAVVARGYWENKAGFTPPFEAKIGAETPDIEGMMRLILTGCFVGYLPTHYAQQWLDSGDIKPLLPSETTLSANIVGIIHQHTDQPRVLEVFLDQLKAAQPG